MSAKPPSRGRDGAPRRALRRLVVAALGVLAVALIAACGSSSSSSSQTSASSAPAASSSSAASGGSGGSLTLGTKNFTEEFIVGQLYKQALTAKGCKINYKENIGATEVVDKALTSHQIDAYPEYTGESVATVAGINKAVTTPQQEYALAKAFYAKRGQVMSQITPFFDTDAIAVTKAYAKQHGLVTTADLKKVGHFTLGARPEFLNREEGALGMKKVYGVKNFSFKSLALGLQYQALDSGAVQAIDVFTTDPQLASGKYVVLKDPKNIFGFQNIALVVNKNKVSACPALMSTVNSINKLLTTPAIIAMNKAVAIDHQQPAAVAGAFLKANHVS
ncbi:MAG TPA: glycine betaine ABC transporter substrate-binding protein [Solirubrobacteraceae bacterium]|jgi:osmoprotectant transport system substrate-binding protein